MATLTVGDITLVVAETGPRIIGLQVGGSSNLFAELADLGIERDGGPPFRFLGGHRLWLAPEMPEITYRPDDDAVTIERLDRGMRARGAADADGVIKEIEVALSPTGTITVDHRIVNGGVAPIQAAPWAITQLPPDGEAILPIAGGSGNGFQANRSVVLWPYTDPGGAGLTWTRDAVIIHESSGPPLKLGVENRLGWLAYQRGAYLFAKWAPLYDDAARYVDRGASVQIYRGPRFIELETLGPLHTVRPGEAVGHRERWRVFDIGALPSGPALPEIFDLLSGGPDGR